MAQKPDKGDEDVQRLVRAAAQQILANPDAASTKLVAWTYGCISKGSEHEEQLCAILKSRLQ